MARRKPQSFREKDVSKPDRPFVALPLRLICSPAWRTRSIHAIRLLDFLMVEHLQHAGHDNGNLMAPWNQLEASGIGRRYIRRAIAEAEARGLIEVHRGGRSAFARDNPTRFRLTFFHARTRDTFGKSYWTGPTNEWSRYSEPERNIDGVKRTPEKKKKQQSDLDGPSPPTQSASTTPIVLRSSKVAVCTPLSIPREGGNQSENPLPKQVSMVGGPPGSAQAMEPAAQDPLHDSVQKWVRKNGHGAATKLAGRAGISPQHLSNFIAGRAGLSIETAARLSAIIQELM